MSHDLHAVIERIASGGRRISAEMRMEYRNGHTGRWDMKLIFPGVADLQSAAAAFDGIHGISEVKVTKPFVMLRLEDCLMANQTTPGVPENGFASSPDNPFAGRNVIVQFIDPNATKAFHLGHLYEAVLGNALASSLQALGARVERYCFVSDISRSVCEAMAGWQSLAEGMGPRAFSEKSDHMVGRFYQAYAQAYYERRPDEADDQDPVRRETALVGDAADILMREYRNKDESVRALWKKIRDWVVEGQMRTLERLGIGIDRFQFGSDTDAIIDDFVGRGIALGILEREPGGAVVYRSGRKEYETVVLTRDDGFPTEHARQIAQMFSVLDICGGVDRYYTLMGKEWKPAWSLYGDIVRPVGGGRYHDIVAPLYHGMVLVEGSKMKSSLGAVILADELLDEVASTDRVTAMAEAAGGTMMAAAFGDIVVKSFFLFQQASRDVRFDFRQLMDPGANPGWEIAAAWARLHEGRAIARGAAAASEIDFARTILLQEADFERVLTQAVERMDLTGAVKFLHRVAVTYSASPGGVAIDALARRVVGKGLTALGMGEGRAAYELDGAAPR